MAPFRLSHWAWAASVVQSWQCRGTSYSWPTGPEPALSYHQWTCSVHCLCGRRWGDEHGWKHMCLQVLLKGSEKKRNPSLSSTCDNISGLQRGRRHLAWLLEEWWSIRWETSWYSMAGHSPWWSSTRSLACYQSPTGACSSRGCAHEETSIQLHGLCCFSHKS